MFKIQITSKNSVSTGYTCSSYALYVDEIVLSKADGETMCVIWLDELVSLHIDGNKVDISGGAPC